MPAEKPPATGRWGGWPPADGLVALGVRVRLGPGGGFRHIPGIRGGHRHLRQQRIRIQGHGREHLAQLFPAKHRILGHRCRRCGGGAGAAAVAARAAGVGAGGGSREQLLASSSAPDRAQKCEMRIAPPTFCVQQRQPRTSLAGGLPHGRLNLVTKTVVATGLRLSRRPAPSVTNRGPRLEPLAREHALAPARSVITGLVAQRAGPGFGFPASLPSSSVPMSAGRRCNLAHASPPPVPKWGGRERGAVTGSGRNRVQAALCQQIKLEHDAAASSPHSQRSIAPTRVSSLTVH